MPNPENPANGTARQTAQHPQRQGQSLAGSQSIAASAGQACSLDTSRHCGSLLLLGLNRQGGWFRR